MPYDLAVFFSSTSSIWSQPGSGHYSSANICLDTMAQKFQHGGVHALSIQYGPFAEVGMASKHVAALESIGMHSLQPREVSCLKYSISYFCKYSWKTSECLMFFLASKCAPRLAFALYGSSPFMSIASSLCFQSVQMLSI